MSAKFEAFLARIYVDADACSRFLTDPHRVAADAGLTPPEIEAAEKIDRLGLQMAAKSFSRKRQAKQENRS